MARAFNELRQSGPIQLVQWGHAVNVPEIREAVAAVVAQDFDASVFPFQFAEAYGAPRATIAQLKRGNRNKSDLDDGILWKPHLHFTAAPQGMIDVGLQALKDSKATSKQNVRYLLTTDGEDVAAYDVKRGESRFCKFSELDEQFGFFLPIGGFERYQAADENPIDIKATGCLARLYDALVKENSDWSAPERRHDLNQLMTRIIFCLFAEDTGIFADNLFAQSLTEYGGKNGENAQSVLKTIFEVMNLEDNARSGYPDWANDFPYVNGGLFAGVIDAPVLTPAAYRYLIEAGALDWKDINPDIFGSMIQSIADEEHRSELGMHYTSVPNILKVLDPLFLNSLKEEVQTAWDSKKNLKAVLGRLSHIRIFDPACGSGNFLVIAYREMRNIEMQVIGRLGELGGGTQMTSQSYVNLSQFFGIELSDFAAETAKLSLWIAEYQMNSRFREAFGVATPALPLRDGGNIVCDNALRMDWEEVCPFPTKLVRSNGFTEAGVASKFKGAEEVPDEASEIYIVGNPPYIGNSLQLPSHKEDLKFAIGDSIKSWKSLDYVAGWFLKAAIYATGRRVRFAFVSTNSIVQGQQVAALWPTLLGMGMEIFFGHSSFVWRNNAAHKAGVMCVVIGVRNISRGSKCLFNEGHRREVGNISPYLVEGKNCVVKKATKPISICSKMEYGNKPADGGALILTKEDRLELLSKAPSSADFIKRYHGSHDTIHGIERFCLWIEDDELDRAKQIPEICARLERVRRFRSDSDKPKTRDQASSPHRFSEVRQSHTAKTIIVPRHSSISRRYLPIDIIGENGVVADSAFAIYSADQWLFSILASRLHLVWVAASCGKIKKDYRYSNTLGWNTFPVPEFSEVDKAELTQGANDILLARETHFPKAIAKLYDSDTMPNEIRDAHQRNDEILERTYIGRPFRNDTERLEHLFERYTKMMAVEKKEKVNA